MRSVVIGVAGVVCGIALVANCGPGGGVYQVLDMMGLVDGASSKPSDGPIGNADATPGNPVSCTPAESFCDGAKLWTCTYTGKDATFATDCAAQGSATNPSTCATTGCPSSSKACCRRAMPLWKWNFSQPALVGEAYVANYDPGSTYIPVSKACTGGSGFGFTSATLVRAPSTCPTTTIYIQPGFDRKKLPNVGVNYPFPTDGMGLSATVGDVGCYNWTGTMRLDSDLPNWSVTINATCADAGKGSFKVIGTMSGNE